MGGGFCPGGGGSDILSGGAGADTLVGGAGNDLYVVDRRTDVVDESTGSGTDTVQSSVSFSLIENPTTVDGTFENLILTGTRNISGTGNDLATKSRGGLLELFDQRRKIVGLEHQPVPAARGGPGTVGKLT